EGATSFDWNYPYRQVFYANVVLDGLNRITPTSDIQREYNIIKGSALFYRAHAFFQIAQVFAKPYNKQTAGSDLGIPLRLTSDINAESTRESLQVTYNQIVDDLLESATLLQESVTYKTRPSKP